MKLKSACEIGVACGLDTTGEAVYNVNIRANQIFGWNDINRELAELKAEYAEIGDRPILDVFPDLKNVLDGYLTAVE